MIKNIKWLLLVSLSFVACNNDDDSATGTEEPVSAGSANFSKYVALGDSFAAGYSDGALFKKGQTNSYPAILASQFALVGGGEFTIPYMEDNVGGFSSGGVQHPAFATRLYFNTLAVPSPAPANVTGVSGTIIGSHIAGTAAYSNLGVPGAKSYHLTAAGFGNPAGIAAGLANPYYARFATSAVASVKSDALVQNPTFFSLWIGGNDVLGYATSGGVTTTESPTTGSNITPTVVFDAAFNELATDLSNGGRKGVVANLPYINTLPYFTTVPYNPVALDATKAAQLNAGYATYNGGLAVAVTNAWITQAEADSRRVVFQAGANPVIIVDNYLTNLTAYGIPSYRPATANDFLVLPSRTFIGTLVGGNPAAINGVSVPLADNWVLSKNEAQEIKVATDAYNVTIEAAATAHGLAFVDAKAVMNQLVAGGVVANGYTFTSTYVTGGTFSLDGIHPSPRGYALIANKFIAAINAKYGSTLKGVNVGTFPILYPKVL